MDKVESVRQELEKKYPGYRGFPNGERMLLAMAYLALNVKVREKGKNGGEWVEAILKTTGLPAGYPWCAAAVEFCCEVAQLSLGPTRGEAAVISWYRWARDNDRLRMKPQRGRLCLWLNPNGTGHIGAVAAISEDGAVTSYEGNTSSGESGNQRDGDGLYRRRRRASVWHHYIEMDEPAD